MKVIQYWIEHAGSLSELRHRVGGLVKEGWQPLGQATFNANPDVTEVIWFQTLVKYEN